MSWFQPRPLTELQGGLFSPQLSGGRATVLELWAQPSAHAGLVGDKVSPPVVVRHLKQGIKLDPGSTEKVAPM